MTLSQAAGRSIPAPLRQFIALLRRNPRPIRDALIIVGVLRAIVHYTVQERQPWTHLGIDTLSYWNVDLAHPYATSVVFAPSAYLYSPAFAQALAPFGAIPFPVFYGLWVLASYLVLGWLVRPWPWAIPIFALPITAELMTGQVQLFLAAAIVVGFSRPGLWALPILTKITPGVGVLWFALRREWRASIEAIGVTLAIVAVSFALSSGPWFEWYQFLTASTGSSGAFLLPRFCLAVGLVAIGALTDRRWLVPIAVWISLPNVYASSWVILLAVIRLLPKADAMPEPDRALKG